MMDARNALRQAPQRQRVHGHRKWHASVRCQGGMRPCDGGDVRDEVLDGGKSAWMEGVLRARDEKEWVWWWL